MRVIASDKVEVHLIRPKTRRSSAKARRGSEFLLMRRSSLRLTLPGVWQPVTGGIERGETAWQAASREVREETGLTPTRWWALEHLSLYYEPAADAFTLLPVFVAELPSGAEPRLSDEHDAWGFVSPATARRRVLWEAQRLAIDAVTREVLAGPVSSRARDITHLVARSRGTARRARPAGPETSRRAGRAPRRSPTRTQRGS